MLRRLFRDGDIRLSIPYITVTGDCSVTLVADIPTNTDGTCPTQTRTVRRCGQTFTVRRTLGQEVTNNGLGDINLMGRYYLAGRTHVHPDHRGHR